MCSFSRVEYHLVKESYEFRTYFVVSLFGFALATGCCLVLARALFGADGDTGAALCDVVAFRGLIGPVLFEFTRLDSVTFAFLVVSRPDFATLPVANLQKSTK